MVSQLPNGAPLTTYGFSTNGRHICHGPTKTRRATGSGTALGTVLGTIYSPKVQYSTGNKTLP